MCVSIRLGDIVICQFQPFYLQLFCLQFPTASSGQPPLATPLLHREGLSGQLTIARSPVALVSIRHATAETQLRAVLQTGFTFLPDSLHHHHHASACFFRVSFPQ